MSSWRANQSISLFGNLAFLNRDNSYGACAIGRTIGRFEVDSYEFHCIALVKVKFLWNLVVRMMHGAQWPPARRRLSSSCARASAASRARWLSWSAT